jgi:hypothetical protein
MPVAAAIGGIVKVGSVVGSVVGAIGGKKAAKSSNQRADELSAEAVAAGKNLQETADTLSARGEDRWNFYKDHGQNVDVMLIDDAVQLFKETFTGGSERAAARAAEDVAAAFDRSAEVRRRAALRFGGVDPTSGKFQGLERETETARAKTEAFARFNARRTEEDRARAVLGRASDVANRAVDQSLRFGSGEILAESRAADIFAGQVPDARSEAAGSAELVGDIAGKIPFERLFEGKDDTPAVTESGGGSAADPASRGFKQGGKIPGYRSGGAIPSDGRGGGKIRGPGTGTSDSVPAVVDGTRQPIRLSAGEFIIPERVVRQRGERFFNQLIRR